MPTGAVPFPFGKCRICNDKATGIHYGVATCEGCKGFFKRSITKAEKYRCFFGGSCILSPKNRNRCKSCRFRRCMDTGMALDAVKMGRIPKVEKEKALEQEKMKLPDDGSDSLEDVPTKTPSTSSGFSSDHSGRGSIDGNSPKDGEALTHGQGYNKAENGAANFLPYPAAQGFGPVFPRQGFEHSENLDSERGKASNDGPVAMQHSGAYPESRLPHETNVPIKGKDHFAPHSHNPNKVDDCFVPVSHRSLANGPMIRGPIPSRSSGGVPMYPEPRGLIQNGPLSGQASKNVTDSASRGQSRVKSEGTVSSESSSLPPEPGSLGLYGKRSDLLGSRDQINSGSKPRTENGPRSAFTEQREGSTCPKMQDGKEQRTEIPSPGLSPVSVYNSDVIKQLFTHALENICQDGMKVQLMEKFLNSGVTRSDGSVTNPPTQLSAQENSVRDMISMYVDSSNRSNVPNTFKDDAVSHKRKAQNDSLSRENKTHTGRPVADTRPVYSNNSTLSASGLHPPRVPNHLGSSGLHKLPQTLPQHVNMMKAAPLHANLGPIPSSIGSSSQGVAQSHYPPHLQNVHRYGDWNEEWSDSYFQDRHVGKMPAAAAMGHNNTQLQNTYQNIKIKTEPGTESENSSCQFSRNVHNTNSSGMFYGQPPKDVSGVFLDNDLEGNACVRGADPTRQYGGSDPVNLKTAHSTNDVQIIDIFSDYVTADQPSEVQSSDNSLSVPLTPDDCSLDDINVEMLDDESLSGAELVSHLERWYMKIETLSLGMIKSLRDDVKNGTHLDNVIPLNSPKPKRKDAEEIWNMLFQNVEPCGLRVASFCKSIPGFSRIPSEDKDTLVTSAFFDLWMICHSPLFYEGDVHITFPQKPGTKYCLYWMSQFLPKELIKKFFDFADVFNSCNLAFSEIAIILAVRATLPDRPGIKSIEEVKKLNKRYLNLLAQTILTNHPSEGGDILHRLFTIFPQLHLINEHQNRVIGSFRIDQLPCSPDDFSDAGTSH